MGDGFLDRRATLRGVGEEVVDERRHPPDQPRQDVDRDQLVPLRGTVADRRDESGPNARAGLSEAPVIGPTTMMIAMTTPPITMPAKSPGERESTIPRIANMRMAVPMPSAKIAAPQA